MPGHMAQELRNNDLWRTLLASACLKDVLHGFLILIDS